MGDLTTDERSELEYLRNVYREVWLYVVDAGSLMLAYKVEKALTGDSSMSDKVQRTGEIHGVQKLPDDIKQRYFEA